MATGGQSFPIWDRRNANEQEDVHGSRYSELLRNAEPSLRVKLRLKDIWTHLRQMEVVQELDVETLKHDATDSVQVERVIKFINTCPAWCFHGLMRACALTDQSHVIRHIGLDPKVYQPWKTVSSLPPDLQKPILQHCDGCRRLLMKRNIYDFRDHHAIDTFDAAQCYVKVKATVGGKSKKTVHIDEKDIFSPLDKKDRPRTLLLYGPVGGGKSNFTSHLVYDWSGNVLQASNDSSSILTGTEDFSIMIYLQGRDIKTTVRQAIYDSLWCRTDHERDLIMAHINNGEGVVVIIDGVDEIHNDDILVELENYVHERHTRGGPQVLVTARNDLCLIASRSFDRFLDLTGFEVSQGKKYVKLYFSMDTLEHIVTSDEILAYVDEHEEKLYPVLTNPLRLHMFCTMISTGYLKMTEVANFSIPKLFKALQICLLERENVKLSTSQSEDFYRLCFYGLMSGIREFPNALLDRFNIDRGCHVFLQRKVSKDLTGVNIIYYFPHEMIYEYFASRHIETLPLDGKKCLLLSVCKSRKLRNVQRIIGDIISQQEEHREHLLQTLIRCIIFLQIELRQARKMNTSRTYYDEVVTQRNSIEVPDTIDECMRSLEDAQGKYANDILPAINKAFDTDAEVLQSEAWLAILEDGIDGLIKHVHDCLTECPPDLHNQIIRSTVYRLLPSRYIDDTHTEVMLYPVGTTRWARIQCDNLPFTSCYIRAWCIQDAYDAVELWGQDGGQSPLKVTLSINGYGDIWGTSCHKDWTQDAWRQLLERVIPQVEGPVLPQVEGLVVPQVEGLVVPQLEGLHAVQGTLMEEGLGVLQQMMQVDGLDIRLQNEGLCAMIMEGLARMQDFVQQLQLLEGEDRLQLGAMRAMVETGQAVLQHLMQVEGLGAQQQPLQVEGLGTVIEEGMAAMQHLFQVLEQNILQVDELDVMIENARGILQTLLQVKGLGRMIEEVLATIIEGGMERLIEEGLDEVIKERLGGVIDVRPLGTIATGMRAIEQLFQQKERGGIVEEGSGCTVWLNMDTPLTGLLSCLSDLHLTHKFEVYCGIIGLEELVTCLRRCQQARVPLRLHGPTLVVPDSADETHLVEMRDTVCGMENSVGGGILAIGMFIPMWLSPDGAEYTWGDEVKS